VTECQLTQGTTLLQNVSSTPSYTIDTTQNPYSVTPTSTTIYTLTCVNSNYSNGTITVTAPVTVSGSSFCEQNPNGVGCPGQ
jgi:uncharacterized protein YpuA (DUF1002 family)